MYDESVRKSRYRMRILMIAPEPFFEPRGTPFSEFHRIRALTDLGHEVDLVTYPFGQDVVMPGLRVFRSLRPPFVRRVKIGPSFAKLPLDALLSLTALRRAFAGKYDAIHSHEEGGLIGIALSAMLRRPALVRHALEPAAAADEFRVQPIDVRAPGVPGDRTAHDPPLAGGHRDLPVARGHRP